MLLQLKGDAANYQPGMSGVYLLQPKMFEGFHYWSLKDDDTKGIRWNKKKNKFLIGCMTANSVGIKSSIDNQEHPNKIKQGCNITIGIKESGLL